VSTQATQEAIERRTEAYLDAMFGARGLFYASESVTREQSSDYVEGIEPGSHFEGLPELRPDLTPGGERPAYFPITYTGPLDEANESRLNYDFYADPEHRIAMDLARAKICAGDEDGLRAERGPPRAITLSLPCDRASSCIYHWADIARDTRSRRKRRGPCE
jgi:CHASE1-domain containing sensor protein